MKITVNGEARTLEPGVSVADLLVTEGLSGRPCAVEINREVVPKRDHDGRALTDGDSVELVTLVGGG